MLGWCWVAAWRRVLGHRRGVAGGVATWAALACWAVHGMACGEAWHGGLECGLAAGAVEAT